MARHVCFFKLQAQAHDNLKFTGGEREGMRGGKGLRLICLLHMYAPMLISRDLHDRTSNVRSIVNSLCLLYQTSFLGTVCTLHDGCTCPVQERAHITLCLKLQELTCHQGPIAQW